MFLGKCKSLCCSSCKTLAPANKTLVYSLFLFCCIPALIVSLSLSLSLVFFVFFQFFKILFSVLPQGSALWSEPSLNTSSTPDWMNDIDNISDAPKLPCYECYQMFFAAHGFQVRRRALVQGLSQSRPVSALSADKPLVVEPYSAQAQLGTLQGEVVCFCTRVCADKYVRAQTERALQQQATRLKIQAELANEEASTQNGPSMCMICFVTKFYCVSFLLIIFCACFSMGLLRSVFVDV